MDLIYAALLLGEWVNEARETAFLEDRSVNAVFYGVEIWHDRRMHTHRHLWDTYRFCQRSPEILPGAIT